MREGKETREEQSTENSFSVFSLSGIVRRLAGFNGFCMANKFQ